MIGRPPGWRWSCDIMRSDDSNLDVPADRLSGQQSLPPGFTYAPQNGASASQSGISMAPMQQNQSFGQSYGGQPIVPSPLFGGGLRR